MHWGEFVEQALRNKILPMLAVRVTDDKYRRMVPRFVKSHLRTVLDYNRRKTVIFRDAAAELVKVLDEQGVKFVGTKGIAFEGTLYEGNGSRNFNLDIDFMIAPRDREVVADTMSQLGYRAGWFNWRTGRIEEHSRKQMLIYKLNPDHIPQLTKLTGDPIVKAVSVDFANSLTWTGSSFDVPIDTALHTIQRQPILGCPDVQLPIFTPFFQFVFTILHLFREAWFERWWDAENDVNLSKFADVVRLWQVYRNELASRNAIQKIDELEITQPVLWVLEHLDRTLNTNIVSTLGMKDQVNEEWLTSLHKTGGDLGQWKGTMRERLHCKERKILLMDSTF